MIRVIFAGVHELESNTLLFKLDLQIKLHVTERRFRAEKLLLLPIHRVRYDQILTFLWSVFSRIQTEYGEIRSTLRIHSEWGKIRTRKNSVFGHHFCNDDFSAYPGKQLPRNKSLCF